MSREDDAKVAELLFGYSNPRLVSSWGEPEETFKVWSERFEYPDSQCGMFKDVETGRNVPGFFPPHFTTDPVAAWQVVEKMFGDCDSIYRGVGVPSGREWEVHIGSIVGHGSTMPEAVCRAALAALAVGKG